MCVSANGTSPYFVEDDHQIPLTCDIQETITTPCLKILACNSSYQMVSAGLASFTSFAFFESCNFSSTDFDYPHYTDRTPPNPSHC